MCSAVALSRLDRVVDIRCETETVRPFDSLFQNKRVGEFLIYSIRPGGFNVEDKLFIDDVQVPPSEDGSESSELPSRSLSKLHNLHCICSSALFTPFCKYLISDSSCSM